ncbi:MAG: response regulator [Candidatus Wallbacteria bacterium]|nr:response regulator [Candidatus Wallbacteria bacterium]
MILTDPAVSGLRVLLVEDDDEHAFIVRKAFGKHLPVAILDRAIDAHEAYKHLDAKSYDIILLDYTLPGTTGLEILRSFPSRGIDCPAIMFTSTGQKELAVEALRSGAYDYVVKTADSLFYIPIIAQRAVEKYGIEREHKMLKDQLLEARTQAEESLRQVSERNVKLRETQRELSSAYDKLLEMNRLKSIFMANMSHELRTPLNAIIGYTSLLLDNIYGGINQRQQECLQRMNRRANELLHQINSILDFSKFEANRMPLFIESFSLREVVAEAEETVRPLLQDAQVRFTMDVGDIPRMRSDRHKVRQILVNLLSNAFKFTEKGDVALAVGYDSSSEMVELTVQDTGIGIREEDLQHIFEEFRQVDGSSTRRFGGTGLGLSIVKKLLELLGGEIYVSSKPEHGSTFRVKLPLALGPAPSAPEPEPTVFSLPELGTSVTRAADTGSRSVLSIDDDEDVIKIVEESLAPEGYSVLGAASGREGLRMAMSSQPSVILLDIALPDMIGWDVLRELKQNPETRNTPVIVMSVIDNKALGFSLGAADYLIKPVGKNKWVESVRRVLQSVQPAA